jgi:predicted negative regulator of RcsB-dependent stress response
MSEEVVKPARWWEIALGAVALVVLVAVVGRIGYGVYNATERDWIKFLEFVTIPLQLAR